jgi:ribonuclease D
MNLLPNHEPGAPPPYELITTSDRFRRMLESLMPASRLAIDIEADSLYHYFEKVCLIQISTDSDTYILDPLAVRNVGEMAALMRDPAVEKVFHAAGYDVYCLTRDYNFTFANLFDTHVAAQLLGYEFLGLGTLMDGILGVHHSKRRQRDDWSVRPLAPEQLEYAAMDTHHLLALRDALEAELRLKGRLSWAQEEFECAASVERREKEFDPEGFRRIKGNRELPLQEQVVLRALYMFRDEIARKLDVPPFKVLNNSVLIDMVRRPPQFAEEMYNRRGISNRVARKYSEGIIDVIAEARKQDPSILEAPVRCNWKSPGRAAKLRMEALKQWRKEKAGELNLPIGVVFPANLLEGLAAIPPSDLDEFANVPGMRRWRTREFGEEIIRLLQTPEPAPHSSADQNSA